MEMCENCSNAAELKVCQNQASANVGRSYYVCPRCRSKNGQGSLFLRWADEQPKPKKGGFQPSRSSPMPIPPLDQSRNGHYAALATPPHPISEDPIYSKLEMLINRVAESVKAGEKSQQLLEAQTQKLVNQMTSMRALMEKFEENLEK